MTRVPVINLAYDAGSERFGLEMREMRTLESPAFDGVQVREGESVETRDYSEGAGSENRGESNRSNPAQARLMGE